MQNQIKEEMSRSIAEQTFDKTPSIFYFSQIEFSNLKWVKPHKEFIIDSQMYDILSIESNNDGIIKVYAINDKEEKAILSLLHHHSNSNESKNLPGSNTHHLLKFISNFYFLGTDNPFFHNPSMVICLQKDISLVFDSFIGDIPSPPPKLT